MGWDPLEKDLMKKRDRFSILRMSVPVRSLTLCQLVKCCGWHYPVWYSCESDSMELSPSRTAKSSERNTEQESEFS
ncbi:hypothetical protein TNCV_3932421 [Trichonephila clavipes]|nr:hypothetical protein TNCV_3932421 [Trichonephila clavipes]